MHYTQFLFSNYDLESKENYFANLMKKVTPRFFLNRQRDFFVSGLSHLDPNSDLICRDLHSKKSPLFLDQDIKINPYPELVKTLNSPMSSFSCHSQKDLSNLLKSNSLTKRSHPQVFSPQVSITPIGNPHRVREQFSRSLGFKRVKHQQEEHSRVNFLSNNTSKISINPSYNTLHNEQISSPLPKKTQQKLHLQQNKRPQTIFNKDSSTSINISTPNTKTNLDALFNLFQVFLVVINGQKLHQNSTPKMTQTETKIFQILMKRKQYKGFGRLMRYVKSGEPGPSKEMYNLISTKRKEESLKFVFRLMAKEMQKRFCILNELNYLKKENYESKFYSFYFGHMVRKNNLLNQFKIPDFAQSVKLDTCKTLNKTFFVNLNSSHIFMKSFNTNLIDLICYTIEIHQENSLRNTKSRNVNLKRNLSIEQNLSNQSENIIEFILQTNKTELNRKLMVWEGILNKQESSEEDISRDINRQTFKFPWTIWEIKNAFIITFIAVNEFKLSKGNRLYVEETEEGSDPKTTRMVLNWKVINTKKKEKIIKNRVKLFHGSIKKYYWLGLLNKPSIDIFESDFGQNDLELNAGNSSGNSEYLSYEVFTETLKIANKRLEFPWKLKNHIFCVIVNLTCAEIFRNKAMMSQKITNGKFILNIIDRDIMRDGILNII